MTNVTKPARDQDVAGRITSMLAELLADARARAKQIDPLQHEIVSHIEHEIIRGGKRIRPKLTYLAYIGLGGPNNGAIIRAAAAMELFHHYLLIHDDVMDRDFVRHGGTNVIGLYFNDYSPNMAQAEAFHYAASVALMAGDIVNVIAHQALLNADFEPGRLLRALAYVEQVLFSVTAGELLDVTLSIPGAPLADFDRLIKIAHYKTATYSFEGPLVVGAILAGTSHKNIAYLENFGRSLGIAFQLTDDLLGVYGSSEDLGKSVGSDMREGKQTVLMYLARERADASQRAILDRAWGNREAGLAELDHMRSILEDTGARKEVEDLARKYELRARTGLTAIELSPASRDQLAAISQSCVDRRF